jgi:hypothetical protein
MLLFLAAPASATDVATKTRLGAGLETGVSWVGATGKYYFGPRAAIAAYAGFGPGEIAARVNWEHEFVRLGNWDLARAAAYWAAGPDFAAYPEFGSVQVGAGGGIGAELQSHDLPLQVFLDLGASVYPLCSHAVYVSFCTVQARGAGGVRYYFK